MVNSRHNLSATGPGPIKVAGETEVCKFCHTPHASNPIAPLWNRSDPGGYYETYTSKTLKTIVGQPTGTSRLCLSCHDGTIALTQTFNSAQPIGGTIYISPGDSGYIGTTLSDDHPISFTYDTSLAAKKGQLKDPASIPQQLPLDSQGQLQCTTCHDAHDDSRGKFLRMGNQSSQLCLSCHDIDGWVTSEHATSTASVTTASRDQWDNVPYNSVRDLACESCHRPHNAGGREGLMRNEPEEDNCLSCHDGSVAADNVASEFNKISTHPIERTLGIHYPGEDSRTMQDHVECSDCHNPHQASGVGSASAPYIKPSMQGVSGFTSQRTHTTAAAYEYEVCYKCHAKRDPVREPLVDRVIRNSDISEKFSLSSLSYHPVEGIGRNTDMPSLLQGYWPTSIIYCTDCHGSDTQSGAKGAHGSSYKPLLVRNYKYSNADETRESPQAYALCYGCHNRESILANESFKLHKKHLKKSSCSACHDPHGVRQNTHLINFDRDVVFPSRKAGTGPTFVDSGFRRGSCTLLCHNKDHDDKDYKP